MQMDHWCNWATVYIIYCDKVLLSFRQLPKTNSLGVDIILRPQDGAEGVIVSLGVEVVGPLPESMQEASQ